jgi:deoxyribonuclease V
LATLSGISPSEAIRLQEELRGRLELDTPVDLKGLELIAAADVSYMKGDERTYAAVAVFSFPDLEPVECRWGSAPVRFPYVPGLLAFREAPALLPVFKRLKSRPGAVLFDGHGIAHPRGFGIASHMGLLLGVPTVGVAKSVLVGEFKMPGERRGCKTRLIHDGRTVGYAVRTRDAVKPVFVSPGHMADLKSSAALVLSCCTGYRLPEPSREAHRLSNLARARGSS